MAGSGDERGTGSGEPAGEGGVCPGPAQGRQGEKVSWTTGLMNYVLST